MLPGDTGKLVRNVTKKFAVPLPHVELCNTETLPESAVEPQLVVIVFVPWPEVIVTPAGTVHVYVTPACVKTEYTAPVAGRHSKSGPVMG